MIKTQFGYEIQRFQSEWGGEYYNVSTYLNNHGIYHRIACTYTPEQNGLIECRNQIIIEKGMSLLAHSSLPHDYWEHTFKTITYVHIAPSHQLLISTHPTPQFIKKGPKCGFLRSFGCLCYPFLRPYNSYKLDFWSLPCVFLGYITSQKGYLCLHSPTSIIYISHHVIFNKEVFPFTNHPPPTHSSLSTITSTSPSSIGILQHASSTISSHHYHLSPSISPTPPTSNTMPPMSISPNPSSSYLSSTSCPSHQCHIINSQDKQTSSPIFSHATNNKHNMITPARTKFLKPIFFSQTPSPLPSLDQ